MRLGPKLILAFLLTALVPLVLLGSMTYLSAKRALEKQILGDFALVAEATEGHVNSFLDRMRERTSDFATDGFIRDTAEGIGRLAPQDPKRAVLGRALNAHLEGNKLPLDPILRGILAIGPDGKVIAATDARDLGRDESGDDYFLHGLNGLTVSDVHRTDHGPAAGRPAVLVAAPLKSRKTGGVAGVIVNVYDGGELRKVLIGHLQPEGGAGGGSPARRESLDVYLVNRERKLITPSRWNGGVLEHRVDTLPVRECAAGRETTGIYRNLAGREVLGASTCFAQTGWTLVAEMEPAEAFAPIAVIRRQVVLLVLATALATAAFAALVARRIRNPVAGLSRITARFAGGETGARAPVASRDEIGDLASAFNAMAERLTGSQNVIVEEKSRLEALIHGVRDGVVFVDADDRVVLLNDAAEEMLGVEDVGAVGMPVLGVLPGLGELVPVLEAFRNGEQGHCVSEIAFRGRDLETASSPIRADGAYIGTALVFRDVTERKRAEAALRESEARLAQAQRIARVGSWEHDFKGGVLHWSDEVCRILGLEPRKTEAAFDDFLDRVHPDDLGEVRKGIERALAGGGSLDVDHRIVLPDGSVRVVHAQAEVTFDEAGRPIRMLGAVQDITEQRQLEEQFRQAQKMETIGRLAGGVAHDFNNMLTVVSGYAQVVLKGMRPDDPLRQDVEIIRQVAERTASLARQLLTFSRQHSSAPRIVSLGALLAGLEKMVGRLVGEDVELSFLSAPDIGNVRIDPGQIEQALMNLAINARDAMPNGGKLTIEAADADLDEAYARRHVGVSPGRYVTLAVSDTGVGMDEETRARIFEPFFTTKEVGKGTGLGLSMVYGIVRQSGGHIEVYSEPGVGTTFKIYFPRVEETAPAGAGTAAGEIPALYPDGKGTILVIEDEEEIRKLVRRVLSSQGYELLVASRGDEAVGVTEKHEGPIDLLLTDVVMPGMSGREAASRLTSLRPRMKVIYMSGYAAGAIARHGVLEPGTAFLQKPFTPDALLRKVREVLGA
ncbi:MAG: PAS domain S-box protein [Nitrospirae bacterium]|nr:PAS domain S-box protein [Nitrospirota bacterium]